MQWYWWVLVAVGVALVAWVKLSVLKRIIARSKEKREAAEEE